MPYRCMKKICFITTCSASKAQEITLGARIQDVLCGNQRSVLQSWLSLVQSTAPVVPLWNLYSGRAIRIMKNVAKVLDAPLFVISAGLGLVDICERRPRYDLTISGKGPSSVLTRINDDTFDTTAWWTGVNHNDSAPIANLIRRNADTLFVLALSFRYFAMVRRDLETLESQWLENLRITGLKAQFDTPLAPCILPYDGRLNGPDSPIPGTLSDFPQRCAVHYTEHCISGFGLKADRAAVFEVIKDMAWPLHSSGKKLSDDEIINLLRTEFEKTGFMKTRMLRHFRGTLRVACEQKRFSYLYDRAIGVD